ncbi:hypothetical protein REC12_18505 [Desulfosporosinus sp. PR]|uniref:hypothetical protein n=1 Tax=Candidatus Desulfosporosinus nitrosoreducens TaxID=3401928 RepID=UPI0027F3D00C|nr:hypothetical protein [Desulfosporosinus sp. PR]MDQ7095584.1 hypothetical protein [Desulfosporosinus sp. PR]
MRKRNYLIGALALGLGVLVGTLGMSLLTNSSSAASFISKLRGQENVHTVSGPVSGSVQSPPAANTMPDRVAEESSSPEQSDPALSPNASSNANAGSNPSGNSNPDGQQNNALALDQNGNSKDTVPASLKDQIIADYKQDIGTFFDAWKSTDIDAFRLKLAKAYSGELFEKHARRAEEYLVQGIGLDVSQINFDRIDVESADASTATLRVDYRYTAKDYNIAEGESFGDAHEQSVHVRVNLVKMNSHWMITGESSLSN